jgi:hypothetical protein
MKTKSKSPTAEKKMNNNSKKVQKKRSARGNSLRDDGNIPLF